jgi:hypothetical protein
MRAPLSDEKVMGLVQDMYRISLAPEFVLRKLFSVRDTNDLRYFFRAAKKTIGHILDFNRR